MSSSLTASASPAMLWAGRVLSALPVLFMVGTGTFALLKPDAFASQFAHYGYPEGAFARITIVEIICAIIYAIPQTSILGAILLTAYLGGATATHVRAGEPFFMPVIFGIVIWLGIFLREGRLRALVPLRK